MSATVLEEDSVVLASLGFTSVRVGSRCAAHGERRCGAPRGGSAQWTGMRFGVKCVCGARSGPGSSSRRGPMLGGAGRRRVHMSTFICAHKTCTSCTGTPFRSICVVCCCHQQFLFTALEHAEPSPRTARRSTLSVHGCYSGFPHLTCAYLCV